MTYSSSFQGHHILRRGMISGIETGGSGGSVNWGRKLLGAAESGAQIFMQEKNTILYVDSGRTMSED